MKRWSSYMAGFLLALAILPGCASHTVSDVQGYQQWFAEKENPCRTSKRVVDMLISMKYLPPEFLALKDHEAAGGKLSYDSLYNNYKHSVTFLMSFVSIQGQEGEDVMYKDLSNYKEYLERNMTLNFDMESRVQLKSDFGSCYPVLSSMENTYGLSKGRDVYLVFSSREESYDLYKQPYWDLIYQDDIYQTGILHFTFQYPDIKAKLPEVKL